MSLDDMYHVERTLARGAGGETELVTIGGVGPFVRKKIAGSLANRGVWSALASCGCDRLPTVAAAYELPDQFVVVYDYVSGEPLESFVEANGRLAAQEAVRLARNLCAAASALHALGVIHRDISPKNIIVAEDGAHLVDFGIARLRRQGASRDTTSLGTWGFASPEQYGFAQTDARSDVFSIGRIMGYMLTGLRPDEDGYDRTLADEGEVSAALRRIIEKASAFEPSKRYQTADELAAALAGGAIAARPDVSQP